MDLCDKKVKELSAPHQQTAMPKLYLDSKKNVKRHSDLDEERQEAHIEDRIGRQPEVVVFPES